MIWDTINRSGSTSLYYLGSYFKYLSKSSTCSQNTCSQNGHSQSFFFYTIYKQVFSKIL